MSVWGAAASMNFQDGELREGWKSGQRAADVREEGHLRHSGDRKPGPQGSKLSSRWLRA